MQAGNQVQNGNGGKEADTSNQLLAQRPYYNPVRRRRIECRDSRHEARYSSGIFSILVAECLLKHFFLVPYGRTVLDKKVRNKKGQYQRIL